MELKQLSCFVATAEELHFGRAAQRLNMLPSALGRQIRILEESLTARLFVRSTRHVALTPAGKLLLNEARAILAQVAKTARAVRETAQAASSVLRIGAIDSAAAGLLPALLFDFRTNHPEIETHLVEHKSAQLIPLLISGRLDLGFVRPPVRDPGLAFEFLLHETLVAALPAGHVLARHRRIRLQDLSGVPLILPNRQVRPHSFRLVTRLLDAVNVQPAAIQEADEKQTIINLVAAGLGIALVPEWTARMQLPGVVYRPLDLPAGPPPRESELGVAWLKDHRCPARDYFLDLMRSQIATVAPRLQAGAAAPASLPAITHR